MSRRFTGAAAEARALDVGAIGKLMSGMRGGFTAASTDSAAPRSFSPAPAAPKHFTPADPDGNPTDGWDPFDTSNEAPEPIVERLDPVAAARAEGYADGLAAGRGQEEAARIADTAAVDRLCEALNSSAFDRDTIAARLRQTVLFLVARLVGESGVSAELLGARIDDAIALLADSSEPAILRLNPDDLELLEGRFPTERVFAIADKAIERGGLLIETKTTVIEDGPSSWLAQLAAAIDKTALPDAR